MTGKLNWGDWEDERDRKLDENIRTIKESFVAISGELSRLEQETRGVGKLYKTKLREYKDRLTEVCILATHIQGACGQLSGELERITRLHERIEGEARDSPHKGGR